MFVVVILFIYWKKNIPGILQNTELHQNIYLIEIHQEHFTVYMSIYISRDIPPLSRSIGTCQLFGRRRYTANLLHLQGKIYSLIKRKLFHEVYTPTIILSKECRLELQILEG